MTRPTTMQWIWIALLIASACAGPDVKPPLGRVDAPLLSSHTVVSLTFDDGGADQYQAGAMLEARGMRGTFYVNSGRFASTGFMTQGQLLTLQASGHEIGGHTVSHTNLPAVSTDEQRRQICNDRHELLRRGFRVTSFAYPYAADSQDIHAIVRECGYNSARDVGGLASEAGGCSGCPFAETYPPYDALRIKTPNSIKTATTLAMMQAYVTQAESNGGGWVPLVFHHVCDGCGATNAITPAQLGEFLDWLAARAPTTTVQTVESVMEGELQPGVLGPEAPEAAGGANLFANPSLELDENDDGLADCWQRGGFGDNAFTWSETEDAHSGSAAQAIEITRWTSGARRLISRQDLGACAPEGRPGHSYVASAFYKSNGPTRFTAYYRNALGGWIWWAQSGLLPLSDGYVTASWTTPALPSGASAISVGLSLYGIGTLVMDDYAIHDSDLTAPSVSVLEPLDSTTVSGVVHIAAAASDGGGIERVELLVNGEIVGVRHAPPFAFDWDSADYAESHIAVSARAFDAAGNAALAESQLVTVGNAPPFDAHAPTVTLLAPLVGQTFAARVAAQLSASDDTAVQHVELFADGALVAASFDAPYSIEWDASGYAEGSTTLLARAFDLAGNNAFSNSVTIAIDRGVRATCNSAPCAATFYNQPVAVQLAPKALDTTSIASIRYTVDGTDPTGPHAFTYGAPFALSRTATVRFVTYDAEGAAATPGQQLVQVDTVAPTGVSIATPAAGATVSGAVPINAVASDDQGIVRVRFYLDGAQLGTRTKTPWRWNWSTTGVARGGHALQVQAEDAAGNWTRSPIVNVQVP